MIFQNFIKQLKSEGCLAVLILNIFSFNLVAKEDIFWLCECELNIANSMLILSTLSETLLWILNIKGLSKNYVKASVCVCGEGVDNFVTYQYIHFEGEG